MQTTVLDQSMSSRDAAAVAAEDGVTHAAVGVIQRSSGMVLLDERPQGKPWAGYWEFPGGKVEPDETPADALKRELQEELGITITRFYPWITRSYRYEAKYDAAGRLESAAKVVKLHFFIVTEWLGEPVGLESQLTSWQDVENVNVGPMLPANAPIFTALGLSPVYAITNLQELGQPLFFECLQAALRNGLKMIQVREHQLSPSELLSFCEAVIKMAAPFGAKVFMNSDVSLARQSGAAGVHLPSYKLMQLQEKPDGMLCGASCHNAEELARAAALGLDYVVLSPVQATLSHADAQPLGWQNFSQLIADYPLPVYALGGMAIEHMDTAREHGAHGIAMQRAVWVTGKA